MKSVFQKLGCGARSKNRSDIKLVDDFFGENLNIPHSSNHFSENKDKKYENEDDIDEDDDIDDDYDDFDDYDDELKSEKASPETTSSKSGKSNNSNKSYKSASGRSLRSGRSGKSIHSGKSLHSGRSSLNSGRSGKSLNSGRSGKSLHSGKSGRSGGSSRSGARSAHVDMAGPYSVSVSSSKVTELRRNTKAPRSPMPSHLNIYIRESPKESSFKPPLSSEAFVPSTINDNILDDNIPSPHKHKAKPKSLSKVNGKKLSTTPKAKGGGQNFGFLDESIPPPPDTADTADTPASSGAATGGTTASSGAASDGANQTRNQKEAAVKETPAEKKIAAASSPAKSKKTPDTIAPTPPMSNTSSKSKAKKSAANAISSDSKYSPLSVVSKKTKSSKTASASASASKAAAAATGTTSATKSAASKQTPALKPPPNSTPTPVDIYPNPTPEDKFFVPPPPPPFLSVVRDVDEHDDYADILISPLTAPTMVPRRPRVWDDDDFSAAPSLAQQKRAVVTVSKRGDANTNFNSGNTTNGNHHKNNAPGVNAPSDSDEKTVTTTKGFDDIYERGKQLGFGAFANVFVATHRPTGAKYAVKEVDRTSMFWNDKDHLEHEINTMFKVREGPNIVQLYEVYSNNNDASEDEDEDEDEDEVEDSLEGRNKRHKRKQRKKKKNLCHLVVELMEGGELFDRIIEKRAFTEREARDSIRCVMEALKYMHDRRVVHRDLKPENLLLKSRDKSKLTPVKLADFGFAKSIKYKNGCRSLCGTPGYLAPEILEQFPSYDVQCDIWSVGVILFLLLGGYLPFDENEEEKVFDRTRNAAYDFHPRCWRKVSFGAKELISKCLTIDPRKRYSAEDCLNHDWMAISKVANNSQLDVDTLQETRSRGKRRMRAAVQTLMAANRLQQLNTDVTNYLDKKRQDSGVSHISYMTTGTRYGHAKFVEDGPSGKPFELFYKKGELLGEDDYCSVHRCIRTQTQMSYDVKHVHLTLLEKSARKTIKDEINVLKLLRGGPHIIRLLDVFEEKNDPDHAYLVFEAMKGGNLLSRIVEKEVYTEREARQVCKTVFTAIEYCHIKKVAHRDIKPQNVFLHEEGDDTTVRVANFGFAKRVTHEDSLHTLCGTANYVAPEILDKTCRGYDQRCDIWSLGVFTYVLLGGYPPFEGVHEDLAVEILKGEYVFDEEYWSEISDSAIRMIKTMLQVDPKKRTKLSSALSCKWMTLEEEQLVLRDLSTAQNSIRETLKPVAKVKAAVNAILARNKFLSIAGMFKHNDTTSIAITRPSRDQTIDEVVENTFRDSFLWGSQMGIGSFSIVHEVMKKETKEIFAGKRIDRNNLDPNDAVALHDEIAALEQVSDCEQIVKLYHVFDEPDYTYLVLECMKGGDLIDRIIEIHNYTEYNAKEVVRNLLMGVAYCHEKQIANRNLKPENLLLTANSDTDVKISDFGYAKTVTHPNSLRTACGTEGYVAPEILEHRPAYDVSCDMWSLGVILYIVLGGYRPFRGEGDEVMRQTRYGEYKFHKRYWSHVSDDAKNLITRMLTVDPVQRITAKNALRNRWIQADEISLAGVDLSDNMRDLNNLRNTNR